MRIEKKYSTTNQPSEPRPGHVYRTISGGSGIVWSKCGGKAAMNDKLWTLLSNTCLAVTVVILVSLTAIVASIALAAIIKIWSSVL